MTLFEKIQAVLLMPRSLLHLLKVKRSLNRNPEPQLLDEAISRKKNIIPVTAVVKSYFWSSRLIPNCKCLPRSVALYQKLSSMGYDVKHKFGVSKSKPEDQFSAHAWVELDGYALNETKNLDQFIELKKLDDIN
jgi:hypothetical protein